MPLNNQLYVRMKKQFGRVEIANQGDLLLVAGVGVYRNGRPGSTVTHPGEYYRVNCPFCNDTRQRLWINHAYGKIDPANGKPITFSAICFNEDCLSEDSNRKLLQEMLLGLRNRNARVIDCITASTTEVPGRQLREMPWPGAVTQIERLDDRHPAIAYLIERGFNKHQLAAFGVMYCTQADGQYLLAGNRIVAPVYMNGVRVGWQARHVGEPRYKDVPKYYTCPGMPKSQLLYNFDRARGKPFIVLVEGITDVWRVGDHAVALLGKTLSAVQSALLKDTWPNKPIAVMLDGEAYDEARQIADSLAASGRNPVVAIRLPVGKDPADLDTAVIWDLVRDQTQRVGILLT